MKKINVNSKIEELYFDEITRKVYLAWKIILVIVLIVAILSFFIPLLHNFLWINIANTINGLIFSLLDFSPFLASNFYSIIIILCIITISLGFILRKNTSISYNKRNKYYNILNRISCIVSLIILIIFILDFTDYAIPKINYKYFPDNVDKNYTENDLIDLGNYFKDELIEMADDFARKDGEIIYNSDLVQRATIDLKRVSKEYKFLKGFYPDKVGYMNDLELEEDDGGTLGYTEGYGIIVDKNQNDIHLLNTITHEFCHTKGLMRESEVEFCAFVAGIKSDEKFSNYSANYAAFYRLTTVLEYINPEANNDVEEEFLNLCLNKNYTEACSLYQKELDFVLNGNDYFEIETYRLRNYVMHKEEIIKILEILYYNNGAQFQLNEENVNISDIENLINIGSKETVKIIVNFNENFETISSYLKENQKYFKYIYQFNSGYEYENYYDKNEALEYYLSPFNKKDLDLLYDDEYDSEYVHERVVRLLLEYYG